MKKHKTKPFNTSTDPLPYQLSNDYMFRAVFQSRPKALESLYRSVLHLAQKDVVTVHLQNPIGFVAQYIAPDNSTYDRTPTASVLSFMFTAESWKWMGLPMPSTMAWIFVVFPPRLFPICWLFSWPAAPFLHRHCAGGS